MHAFRTELYVLLSKRISAPSNFCHLAKKYVNLQYDTTNAGGMIPAEIVVYVIIHEYGLKYDFSAGKWIKFQ